MGKRVRHQLTKGEAEQSYDQGSHQCAARSRGPCSQRPHGLVAKRTRAADVCRVSQGDFSRIKQDPAPSRACGYAW